MERPHITTKRQIAHPDRLTAQPEAAQLLVSGIGIAAGGSVGSEERERQDEKGDRPASYGQHADSDSEQEGLLHSLPDHGSQEAIDGFECNTQISLSRR